MNINPILLQKQLRENSSDLKDFANDLKKWGEEMKRKEESLQSIVQPPNKVKIRKTSLPKNKREHKKTDTKIGATDYAAWEKFDVEAELEKLENDNEEDSELTDECNESMYDEAILEKEKGNKFVKNQKWDEAIKCYTKAINCYSYDPIFYANRALCYLKKNMFTEAEGDCNLSLKLDQTYVKAYQRRAAARVGLNKLEYAERDYLRVLELEPKNKETRKELDSLRQKLNKSATTIKPTEQRPVSKFTASRNKSVNFNTSGSNIFESQGIQNTSSSDSNTIVIDDSRPGPSWSSDDIVVKAINKKPHLRSQKPLRRVEIIEVTDNEPFNVDESGEAVKTHVMEKKQILRKNSSIDESGDGIKAFVVEKKQTEEARENSDKPEKSINTHFVKDDQIEHTTVSNKLSDEGTVDKPKENKTDVKVENPSEIISEFKKKQKLRSMRNSQNTAAWPKHDQQSNFINSDDIKIIERKNPKEEKDNFNIDVKFENDDFDKNYVAPKNSVQFYSAWKNLKYTQDKYRYLRKIDPPEIPKIFQSSLESSVFSSVVEVLAEHFVKNETPVSKILNYLSEVKRFSAITMFMTNEDKNNLWKLFDYIKETNEMSKEEVDKLIQKYEL